MIYFRVPEQSHDFGPRSVMHVVKIMRPFWKCQKSSRHQCQLVWSLSQNSVLLVLSVLFLSLATFLVLLSNHFQSISSPFFITNHGIGPEGMEGWGRDPRRERDTMDTGSGRLIWDTDPHSGFSTHILSARSTHVHLSFSIRE